MSYETKAASMSPAEVASLLHSHAKQKRAIAEQEQSIAELKQRVAWFERQLFGSKSERRIFDENGRQLTLGEIRREEASEPTTITIPAHRRRKDQSESKGDDQGLRFDESVPVEEIIVENKSITNLDEYAKVGEKVTCRLAQRPGAYVVLRYRRPVYKRKSDGEFSCAPAPPGVLEKRCADASFLTGLLIDKLVYHLPLYRQHQRLAAAGVHLARSTLTNLVHRTADLLVPVYEAQLRSILASKVLAMDETPIKAGRKKRPAPQRGKMQTGYYWPLYGDQDEIAFPFAMTRGSAVVREALKGYGGVLLTDGYQVYDQYAKRMEKIVHAQCWSHTRRQFEKAEGAEPARVNKALKWIARLYRKEMELKERGLEAEKALVYRSEHSKPIVDEFFIWLREELATEVLLPTNPFTRAARYALDREKSLRVFLEYPDVPIDTNHLERAIRPIALGRNYDHLGIMRSFSGGSREQVPSRAPEVRIIKETPGTGAGDHRHGSGGHYWPVAQRTRVLFA